MNVEELTRDQIVELKQSYLCSGGENVSYGELAGADDSVSDSTVFEVYSGIVFTDGDFSCTCAA